MINAAAKTRLSVAAGVFNAVFAVIFLVLTALSAYYIIVFNQIVPEAGWQYNIITLLVGYFLIGLVNILYIGLIGGCIITFVIYTAISVITLISAKNPNGTLIKIFQIISITVSALLLSLYLWYAFVALWHLGEPLTHGDAVTFAVATPIAAIAAVNLINGSIIIAKKKAVRTA